MKFLAPPIGIVKADVGLSAVDNTSDATKDAAVATLTNKTLTGATNTLTASLLKSATTEISIVAAIAPTAGQVLTASSSTVAAWATPSSSTVLGTGANSIAETPTGLINGTNAVYTLTSTPSNPNGVIVLLNGVVQYNGAGLDYTVSGLTITFTTAPTTGSTIFAYYGSLSAVGVSNVAANYSPAAAGTATLDLSISNDNRIVMPAGNITIALSNETSATRFLVSVTQDSVGSRIVSWFNTIKWAGGGVPTLTTTANKRDMFGFVRTGVNTFDGVIVGKNI